MEDEKAEEGSAINNNIEEGSNKSKSPLKSEAN